ncbi:RING/U-box superfamily protein [Artemisia annua]|uniref:RING/U-box superfamily protein n=1 Tax=Artemisia annua TaxID=35608 RepID=A0A2U1L4W3_ARTAN|nr:RING/U-box superfamily protein [Artemisia annua]
MCANYNNLKLHLPYVNLEILNGLPMATSYLLNCDDISLYSYPENPQGLELLGEIIAGISSENVANETKESDCKGQTSFQLIATEDVDAEIEEIKKSNTTFISPEECPTCLEG